MVYEVSGPGIKSEPSCNILYPLTHCTRGLNLHLCNNPSCCTWILNPWCHSGNSFFVIKMFKSTNIIYLIVNNFILNVVENHVLKFRFFSLKLSQIKLQILPSISNLDNNVLIQLHNCFPLLTYGIIIIANMTIDCTELLCALLLLIHISTPYYRYYFPQFKCRNKQKINYTLIILINYKCI